MFERLGDTVLGLCNKAQSRVLIVAPFMKEHALQRILDATSDDVAEVICVARFRPEDVVAGVSDLGVYDAICKRAGARLRLHSYLHAKLFRADEECLVGSANVTGRALGWANPANLELLIDAPASHPSIVILEKRLLQESIEVTDEIWESLSTEVERLLAQRSEQDDEEARAPSFDSANWLPTCSVPDQLWNVYSGKKINVVLESNVNAAKEDLRALDVPGGLPEIAFYAAVSIAFKGMPIVETVRGQIEDGIRDKDGPELVAAFAEGRRLLDTYESSDLWDILKEWLAIYLREEMQLETEGEVLRPRRSRIR